MAGNISDTFYLVLSPKSRGWGLTARLTARRPSLARDELFVQLDVAVPEALFKRPALHAKVSVPENATIGQTIINAEVADNVRELLEKQLGMRVDVSVPEPEERGE